MRQVKLFTISLILLSCVDIQFKRTSTITLNIRTMKTEREHIAQIKSIGKRAGMSEQETNKLLDSLQQLPNGYERFIKDFYSKSKTN